MVSHLEFTDGELARLERQLAEDGYESIEDWMMDSDYYFSEEAQEWFENGDPWSEAYDPWTQYYWAKEAENESIRVLLTEPLADFGDETYSTKDLLIAMLIVAVLFFIIGFGTGVRLS